MKKRILGVILTVMMIVCLMGCGADEQSTTKDKTEETSMFVTVESNGAWSVVYHKETRVMYAVSGTYHNCGIFTLLVNADGTPMIWEE